MPPPQAKDPKGDGATTKKPAQPAPAQGQAPPAAAAGGGAAAAPAAQLAGKVPSPAALMSQLKVNWEQQVEKLKEGCAGVFIAPLAARTQGNQQ